MLILSQKRDRAGICDIAALADLFAIETSSTRAESSNLGADTSLSALGQELQGQLSA